MYLSHNSIIYFDNAATSLPKPDCVIESVTQALASFGGSGRGSHPAALEAARGVFQARLAVAALLGSAPERTVFTNNATESLNIAINGLLNPQDHIITTALEHNSVLRPLYRLQKQDMELSILPVDQHGNIDYGDFDKYLRPNTKAVICAHASNVTGLILDLDIIGSFCQKHQLTLIVDASQTAGVLPINVDQQKIDILCFTGHKGLMGPQGTGGLCLAKNQHLPPLKVGGSGIHSYQHEHPSELPESLEAGTLNAHGIAGLKAGINYIQTITSQAIYKKESDLCQKFITGIQNIANVHIYGDLTKPRVPIVLLNIGNINSSDVADQLAEKYGICVRAGAHCAPLVHLALGTEKQGAVRFSFSSFNTEQEIDIAVQAVNDIANRAK